MTTFSPWFSENTQNRPGFEATPQMAEISAIHYIHVKELTDILFKIEKMSIARFSAKNKLASTFSSVKIGKNVYSK